MARSRGGPFLAWALWVVSVALAVVGGAFLIASWSTPSPEGAFGFRGFASLFAVLFATVGALVASRQPANPIGWLLVAVGVLSAVQGLANEYAIWAVLHQDPARALGEFAAWFPAWIWIPATAPPMFVLMLFPDGRLLSPRWRGAVAIGIAGVVVGGGALAIVPGPLENFAPVDNPFGIGRRGSTLTVAQLGQLVYGVGFILSLFSVAVRFRRSRGDERQQMKWLVASGVFLVMTLVTSFVVSIIVPGPGTEVPPLVATIVITGFASLPIAMGFAILKYRLYEIDVVISKTLVIGLLAVFITAVYVAIVIGVGAVIGTRADAVLSAIAAAVVALAFQPVRARARRVADRLVYGERATPYEVLSEFSGRLGETYAADEVLPRMARILADGTGAANATVWLSVDGGMRAAATWPPDARIDGVAPEDAVDVTHRGEVLGALSVATAANDPLDPARVRLIRDLAAQAGLVLRNVRLVEELRESRRRIVAAQDARAKQLERNIHDGAQQQLVALAVKQRLAASLVGRDDARARSLLEQLQTETRQALDDLRDLARGIYPPLLADRGLATALRAQAERATVPITVSTDGDARYPQEVETAVYFSCLEALQNISKYAGASHAEIRLTNGAGVLAFEVVDDGCGFDPGSTSSGTGLQGMTDRVAAIGGTLVVESSPGSGTSVRGSVPVEVAS